MGFLSFLLQVCFLPITVGAQDAVPDLSPTFIEKPGNGIYAQSGDRVTIHFMVLDSNGKELANSERRGLSHTMDLFGSPSDPLLQAAALGAREGETRYLVLMAEDVVPEVGSFNLIRNPGPLLVKIQIERILRR